MNLQTLRRKALANQLEVEHMLAAARDEVAGLADELDRLIVECAWTDGGPTLDGNQIIPFKRWAMVAITYSRSSYSGLCSLGQNPEFFPFILSLLETLHSPEAAATVSQISGDVIRHPEAHFPQALLLIRTLNFLFSFKSPVPIHANMESAFREFLHRSLKLASTDTDRACIALALRDLGNFDSIELIQNLPAMTGAWSDSPAVAIRAIRKRQK